MKLKHTSKLVAAVVFVTVVTLFRVPIASAQQQTGAPTQATSNPQNLNQSLQSTDTIRQNTNQTRLFNSTDLTINIPKTTPKTVSETSSVKPETNKTLLWLTLTLVSGLSLAVLLMTIAARSQRQSKIATQVIQNANVSDTLVASRKVYGKRKRRSKTTRRQRRSQSR